MTGLHRSGSKKSGGLSTVPLFLAFSFFCVGLYQLSKTPYLYVPIPDSDVAFYWYIAQRIKDDFFLHIFPYNFFSPVFAYLFFAYSLLGNPITVSVFANLIWFVVSVYLVMKITKYLYGGGYTPVLSGLLMVGSPLPLFYFLLPQKTGFAIMCYLLFLFFSVRFKSKTDYILTGVFAGLSGLLQGFFLPLYLLVAVYLLFKKGIKPVILSVVGFAFIVALFGLRNAVVGKTFLPFNITAGIHLYIGNNGSSTGLYTPIPGIRPNALGHYYDSIRYAGREAGIKNPAGLNSYWREKALSWIVENKKDAFILYLKKLRLFFSDMEIPNNYNYYLFRERIGLLKMLPFTFPVLFGLGMVGLFWSIVRRNINPVVLTAVAYPFLLSLFFITGRYRIFFVINLIILSSYGIAVLVENLKGKNYKPVAVSVFGIALFFLFSVFLLPDKKKYIERFNTLYLQKERITTKLWEVERLNTRDKNLKKANLFYRNRMYEIGNYLRKRQQDK